MMEGINYEYIRNIIKEDQENDEQSPSFNFKGWIMSLNDEQIEKAKKMFVDYSKSAMDKFQLAVGGIDIDYVYKHYATLMDSYKKILSDEFAITDSDLMKELCEFFKPIGTKDAPYATAYDLIDAYNELDDENKQKIRKEWEDYKKEHTSETDDKDNKENDKADEEDNKDNDKTDDKENDKTDDKDNKDNDENTDDDTKQQFLFMTNGLYSMELKWKDIAELDDSNVKKVIKDFGIKDDESLERFLSQLRNTRIFQTEEGMSISVLDMLSMITEGEDNIPLFVKICNLIVNDKNVYDKLRKEFDEELNDEVEHFNRLMRIITFNANQFKDKNVFKVPFGKAYDTSKLNCPILKDAQTLEDIHLRCELYNKENSEKNQTEESLQQMQDILCEDFKSNILAIVKHIGDSINKGIEYIKNMTADLFKDHIKEVMQFFNSMEDVYNVLTKKYGKDIIPNPEKYLKIKSKTEEPTKGKLGNSTDGKSDNTSNAETDNYKLGDEVTEDNVEKAISVFEKASNLKRFCTKYKDSVDKDKKFDKGGLLKQTEKCEWLKVNGITSESTFGDLCKIFGVSNEPIVGESLGSLRNYVSSYITEKADAFVGDFVMACTKLQKCYESIIKIKGNYKPNKR